MKIDEYDWNQKKVLVTGASGFKGSWLCAYLTRLGAVVHGTIRDKKSPLSAYNLFDLDEKIVKITMDITNRQQVYDVINSIHPDVIFHLAAVAIVPVSLRDPRRAYDVNIMGTLNILEATRRLGIVERVLICSTDHVFGSDKYIPEKGFEETTRVSHGGPYDTSKAAMELAVRSYFYTYWDELPSIGITRCANVFGGGDVSPRRVVPLFVQSAMNDNEITLKYRNNGRQFIHITDAIYGYVLAASSLNEGSAITKKSMKRPDKQDRAPFTPTFHFSIEDYGVTTEPFIRMENFAKLVSSIVPATINDEECIDYAPNENKIQALNCSGTRKSLNWSVSKTLREGVEELHSWYSNIESIGESKKHLEAEIEKMANI